MEMNFVRTLSHNEIETIINGVIATNTDADVDYYPNTKDLTTIDDVINNFPSEFDTIDFVHAVGELAYNTASNNKGLWWEVLETCLMMRTTAETTETTPNPPVMEVLAMSFKRKLSLEEVTEITSEVIKEYLAQDALLMGNEEFQTIMEEELRDYDEESDTTSDEMYEMFATEVNNFPEIAVGDDFMQVINKMGHYINNPGLWWDAIEYCLAKRVGRSGNCLA